MFLQINLKVFLNNERTIKVEKLAPKVNFLDLISFLEVVDNTVAEFSSDECIVTRSDFSNDDVSLACY